MLTVLIKPLLNFLIRNTLCIQPFVIRNPNRGLKHIGYNFLKDCDSNFINIPCGYCPECIAIKQMYLVQRIQMESLYNHLFFGTLTYNDECLPVIDVNGYNIRYADLNHVILSIKRLRKDEAFGRPFRYFLVSELGSKKGRPHFHILILIPKLDSDNYYTCLNLEKVIYDKLKSYWSFNIGTNRKPVYKSRFTYVQKFIHGELKSNYDLHYVNPALTSNGISDVAFYVLKYMLKHSDRAERLQQALRLNLDASDYAFTWQLVRPRWQASHGFGLNEFHGRFDPRIIKYLHDCVTKTPVGSPYPYYFNPINGMSFPLAPYYRRVGSIYSLQDALNIYYSADDKFIERNFSQDVKKFKDFIKKVQSTETHGDALYFDELCY